METAAEEIEYLTFSVSDTLCGIDILEIQEIIKVSDVTSVPQSPDFVEGIINMRGRIVTIINLGLKLGLKPVVRQKENKILVVAQGEDLIGMMIGDINAVLTSRRSEIEPAPANMGGVQGDLFEGVIKTETSLVGILKIQKVLSV